MKFPNVIPLISFYFYREISLPFYSSSLFIYNLSKLMCQSILFSTQHSIKYSADPSMRIFLAFSINSWPVNRDQRDQVDAREEVIGDRESRGREDESRDSKKSRGPLNAKAGRDSIVVEVYAIPPSHHSPVEFADGCRSVVTLALLIACPTKVYHYYCHPLFPASAPNPLVSPRVHLPTPFLHRSNLLLLSLSLSFLPLHLSTSSVFLLSTTAFRSACKLSKLHSSGSRPFRLDSAELSATFALPYFNFRLPLYNLTTRNPSSRLIETPPRRWRSSPGPASLPSAFRFLPPPI